MGNPFKGTTNTCSTRASELGNTCVWRARPTTFDKGKKKKAILRATKLVVGLSCYVSFSSFLSFC